MVKSSMQNTKYLIKGEFSTIGYIEKTDLIGAFFGQTEGLIGDELEFQTLQKLGKLGRIEISIRKYKDSTKGKFEIPTSLDKVEVSLVAASIESIEKIGHCISEIKILEILDVREDKRALIIKRAEELLSSLKENLPNSTQISQDINDKYQVKKVVKYPNETFGGPDIKILDEIILVEGRADVSNMIKLGFENVICFNGSSKINNFLINLCENKIVTAFLDDDNPGHKEFEVLKNKLNLTYVCFAPNGKEVEELNLKEINSALKNKKQLKEETDLKEGIDLKGDNELKNIFNKIKIIVSNEKKNIQEKADEYFPIIEKKVKDTTKIISNKLDDIIDEKYNTLEVEDKIKKNYFSKKEYDKIKKNIDLSLKNQEFIFLNDNLDIVLKDDYSNINSKNIKNPNYIKNAKYLIFPKVCEKSLLNIAIQKNIKIIFCKSKSKLEDENIKIRLFSEFNNL